MPIKKKTIIILGIISLCGCVNKNNQTFFEMNNIDFSHLKETVENIQMFSFKWPIDSVIGKTYNLSTKEDSVEFLNYLNNLKVNRTDEIIYSTNCKQDITINTTEKNYLLNFTNRSFYSNNILYYLNDEREDFGLTNPSLSLHLPNGQLTSYCDGIQIETIDNQNDTLPMSYSRDYISIDRSNSLFYKYTNLGLSEVFVPLGNDNYLYTGDTSDGNVFKIPNMTLPELNISYAEVCYITFNYNENCLQMKYKKNGFVQISILMEDIYYYLKNCLNINNPNISQLYHNNQPLNEDFDIKSDMIVAL